MVDANRTSKARVVLVLLPDDAKKLTEVAASRVQKRSEAVTVLVREAWDALQARNRHRTV